MPIARKDVPHVHPLPTLAEVRRRLWVCLTAIEFMRDHLSRQETVEAAETMRDVVENPEIIEGAWELLAKEGKAR